MSHTVAVGAAPLGPIVLGYNTAVHNPAAPEHDLLGNVHNQLVMRAGAYRNGTWVVGVAKYGREEGSSLGVLH
jgi:hypothetical protein